jgi:NAD(P)-dependent dehydrogenase (short-subunit alcohol dehydrogenase family)
MDSIAFEGRSAIVTGAAGGIGRVIAMALAARGAQVLVNDLRGAEATVATIREHGGTAVADATPVGDFAAARGIVDAALAAFGRVDILVNNAGTSAPGAFDEPSEAQYLQVLQVNLLGALALSRAAWPLLRAQAYGRILNIASNAALGQGLSAAYAASKGGLIALTKDNAREGAAANIRANAMLPVASTTMTARIPPGAFRDWIDHGFAPEKIAAPALYLLSEQVAASGEIFSCGGGRIARTAYCTTRGHFDADATPESIAAHFAEVMGGGDVRIVANQAEELDRYTEWLPWPEADGTPGLKA